MNEYSLLIGEPVKERVESERFYKLESKVEQIDEKVSEQNGSMKKTADAIESVNLTLVNINATLETFKEIKTEINTEIKPRIDKLETKVQGLYLKISTFIGGMGVAAFLLGDVLKRLLS